MTVRLRNVEPAPDVFASVMATGIVSIGARKHHYVWISQALGVIATLGLVILVVLVVVVAVTQRGIAFWDLTDPDVTLKLFTFVAACAVVDSRLTAYPVVILLLGAVTFPSWLVLLVLTARNMTARPPAVLRDHAHGAWELASAGTSGLAIVIAQVARNTSHRIWLAAATPIWVLALCIYGVMTWLILWRTVHERLDRDGLEPDAWILMGALAIATLAGDHVYQLSPDWLAGSVRVVTVVTWVVATLWIPPLIYFVLHRINQHPALLQFHDVWWALVFPLGMYSVATSATASELGVRSLPTASLVFFWNVLAVWLIVVIAGLLRVRRVFLQ